MNTLNQQTNLSSVPRPYRSLPRGAGLALAATLALGAPLTATLPASASPAASESASATEGANPRGPVPVYQAAGERVTGGNDLAGAAELQAGVHHDVLDSGDSETNAKDGTVRYYRLPALKDGERLYMSAVGAVDKQQRTDSNGYSGLRLKLVNQQGKDCGGKWSEDTGPGRAAPHPVATTSTDPMDPEATYGCFEDHSGVVVAQLERSGTWQADTPLPVELHVWVAPPVNENELNEAPSGNQPPQSVSITGEATPLEGGSSFGTAVTAEPGKVHAVEIRPHQVQYFKVPVEYGQRLNYRLSQGNNRDASVQNISGSVFTPLLRKPQTLNYDASLSYLSPGEVATQNLAVPVSPDNDGHYTFESLRVAGDYYIVVSASSARSNREGSQPFRYELAVEVTGEPGGTTDWVTAAQEQAQQAAGAGTGSDGQAEASDGSVGGPTGTEIGALIGGIGAGALLAGVAWLLLRRRGHQA